MSRPFGVTGYTPPKRPDVRNFPLEKAQAIAPFPASYKADISTLGVFDQSKIPDCVENAITFVKKYHIKRDYNLLLDLSRRFLAIWTVVKDGFPLDEGTSVENALYEAHKRGICESVFLADNHDLDINTFASRSALTDAANANGTTHTIASYAFVTDRSVNGLKNAIYQNGVIVVGAIINQNWWTKSTGEVSWRKEDLLPIRPPKTRDPKVDTSVSGHCFVVYGYDEQYFYFRNSFGVEWADNGDGYFKVDEVPFIYEAATIVDISPEKIQELKSDVAAVSDAVSHVDPSTVDGQKQLGLIALATQLISRFIAKLLGGGGN